MKTETRHIVIGAAVLGVIILVTSLLMQHRPGEEAGGYRLEAVHRDVTGLRPGSDVVLAGQKVGHVSDLQYMPESRDVLVEMHIDTGIPIPDDSISLIVTSGLLGSKHVRIEAGASEEFLEPDSHFEMVQDSILIEEVLELITPASVGKK